MVTKGDTQVIKDVQKEGRISSLEVFVKPESGFEGVRHNVQGTDNNQYAAWFPMEREYSLHRVSFDGVSLNVEATLRHRREPYGSILIVIHYLHIMTDAFQA